MISLTEYIQADRWVETIDEEVIKVAEAYNLAYDNKTNKTIVRLFDNEEKLIGEGQFDNSEMAIAILEEYFDLDESDKSWNDSYDWVNAEQKIDEGLESIEKFIQRNADEYHVRIDYIEPDAQFDGMFGIEVFFNSSNNRNDLSSFVKEVGNELLRTYGIQSYDFDGSSWKLAL